MTQNGERVGISPSHCLEAWARHLSLREHQIAVFLCCDTWCKGVAEGPVSLGELAVRARVGPAVVDRILRSLRTKRVLSKLIYLTNGTAHVALTPGWRMDEQVSP
jgi:hypothetical protein